MQPSDVGVHNRDCLMEMRHPEIQADLAGYSPAEIAEAGRQAEAFLEGPAYAAIATAVRGYQGQRTGLLMQMTATNEGAIYADAVGELRGISRIDPLIRGVVTSGKQAEAQLRAAEERGQD